MPRDTSPLRVSYHPLIRLGVLAYVCRFDDLARLVVAVPHSMMQTLQRARRGVDPRRGPLLPPSVSSEGLVSMSSGFHGGLRSAQTAANDDAS
jgi:hypothetical protein